MRGSADPNAQDGNADSATAPRSYLVKHSLSSSERRLFLHHTASGRRSPLTTVSLSQRTPSVQINQDRPLAQVPVFVFDALVDMLAKALPNGVAVDADVGVARYRFPARRGGKVRMWSKKRQTGRDTIKRLASRNFFNIPCMSTKDGGHCSIVVMEGRALKLIS